MLDSAKLFDNPVVPGESSLYPTFPTISRKPALKTKYSTIDPTLRSDLENGMEATRARFTRRRRQWTVAIDFMTPTDIATLDSFVENDVVYGAAIFTFPELPTGATPSNVRFSKIPEYTDAGWVDGSFRQNCTFELREV